MHDADCGKGQDADRECKWRGLELARHLDRRAENQACGTRRRADESGLHFWNRGEAFVDTAQRRRHHQRQCHLPGKAQQDADDTLEAVTDQHGGVHRVRTGQDLADAQYGGEFLLAEPTDVHASIPSGDRIDIFRLATSRLPPFSASTSLRGERVTTFAFDLGYSSPAAFSTMFKQIMGTAPQNYRRASHAMQR